MLVHATQYIHLKMVNYQKKLSANECGEAGSVSIETLSQKEEEKSVFS